MNLAAPTRRALGLTAVSAIAMSTAVLSLGGVASAAPVELEPISFDSAQDTQVVVPDTGYCAIEWQVVGGSGGAALNAGPGEPSVGGELRGRSAVTGGEVFGIFPGTRGEDGSIAEGGGAGGTTDASVDGYVLVGGVGGDVYEDENAVPLVGSGGSGGGGAATVVTGPDGFLLLAYGGNGGGDHPGTGGEYGTNVVDVDFDAVSNGSAAVLGGGVVSGQIVPCPPAPPTTPVVLDTPSAPQYLYAQGRDGALDVFFSPGQFDADTQSPVTGYKISTDGGATFGPLTTTTDEYGDVVGSVTGLANGTTYQVQVLATSAVGDSPATASVPTLVYRPISAPGNLSATHTPAGGLRITWDASIADGTYGLAGYLVGWNGGQMGGGFCENATTVLTCDVAPEDVPTSTTYWVTVRAVDAEGNPGEWAETAAVGIPEAVPTKTGDLSTTASSTSDIRAGSTITITGGGYAPNSAVTILVYSEPQVLTTTVADGNGWISVTVTVPDGLAAGQHTLVAAGVDVNGDPVYLTLPITVTGGTTGSGGLAYTGADVAVPAIGGLAALAIGGGLVLAGKRRRAAE